MSDLNAKENNQSNVENKKVTVNVPVSLVITVPVEIEGEPVSFEDDKIFESRCVNPEDNEELLKRTIDAIGKSQVYSDVLTNMIAIAIKAKARNDCIKCYYSSFAGITAEEKL